jgi:hypothetical protein
VTCINSRTKDGVKVVASSRNSSRLVCRLGNVQGVVHSVEIINQRLYPIVVVCIGSIRNEQQKIEFGPIGPDVGQMSWTRSKRYISTRCVFDDVQLRPVHQRGRETIFATVRHQRMNGEPKELEVEIEVDC